MEIKGNVIKDIIVGSVFEIGKSWDAAIEVDGKDLINHSSQGVMNIMNKIDCIKDGNVIIPVKSKLVEKNAYGGAMEYVFMVGTHTIKLDLYFENEEEYIKEA